MVYKILFVIFAFIFSMVLSAEDAGGLDKRVEARWKAVEAKDYNKMYQFQTPTYRKVFSKKLYGYAFGRSVSVKLKKVEKIIIDNEAQIATVHADISTESMIKKDSKKSSTRIDIKIQEKWMYFENQWWYNNNK